MKRSAPARWSHALSLLLVATALQGCTLEGFDVEPCSLNGALAFRIHEIDNWLSDYQPRPDEMLVLAKFGPHSRYPGMWSTDLHRDNGYESRPAMTAVVYGQVLQKWDVNQRALPLRNGIEYTMIIGDGGRDGYASFVAGGTYPIC